MLHRFMPLVAVALVATTAFAVLPDAQAAPAQTTVVLDITGMD